MMKNIPVMLAVCLAGCCQQESPQQAIPRAQTKLGKGGHLAGAHKPIGKPGEAPVSKDGKSAAPQDNPAQAKPAPAKDKPAAKPAAKVEEPLIHGKPADHWIKALKSPDKEVRKKAARDLNPPDDEEAVLAPALTEALFDSEHVVRESAFQALSQMDADVIAALTKSLQKSLGAKEAQTRQRAASCLGLLGEDARKAVPDLVKLMKDPSEQVRIQASFALGHIGASPDSAVPALVSCLIDASAEVRTTAAEALSHFGTSALPAIPDLTKALKDAKPGVRLEASSTLGRIAQSAVEEIRDLANQDHPDSNKLASVRKVSKQAITALTAAFQVPDSMVRLRALVDMADLGDEAELAVPAVVVLLAKDPLAEVRGKAADTLGAIKPGAKEATDGLKAALQDSDVHVRIKAAQALGKVKGHAGEAVPVLCNVLKDAASKATQREDAARALGKLGTEASAAVPELEKALKDKSESVRDAAGEALKKIDPAAAEKAGVK